MTSRRDLLKAGATIGALALPGTLVAEQSHPGHASQGAAGGGRKAAGKKATAAAAPPAALTEGFRLRFDGLCAIVHLKSGPAIDVGLVNNAITAEVNVRPHIPTLTVPSEAVLSGSAVPDTSTSTDALWNLDGWIVDFHVEDGMAENALTVNTGKPKDEAGKELEIECPDDDQHWSTLHWVPFATHFASGKVLREDWRGRDSTSALVRLRKGYVDRHDLRPRHGDVAGRHYIKKYFGDGMPIGTPKFLKGFFNYELLKAKIVTIKMTRQPELPKAERIVRVSPTFGAEILNLPVGPKLGKDDPYKDVAAYYDLLELPPPLTERGIPWTTTPCPDYERTDGCACCPPFRFDEP